VANVGVILYPEPGGTEVPGSLLRSRFQRFLTGLLSTRPEFQHAEVMALPRGGALSMDLRGRRTYGDGFLLAGEAAGLVDPLTGEGISLALKSGQMAAQVARVALHRNDVSAGALASYGDILDQTYRRYFQLATQLRTRLAEPALASAVVRVARSGVGALVGGWSPGSLLQTAGVVAGSLRTLGTTPFLAWRAYMAHARTAWRPDGG
jgi:flavin-dependent dehydrogenase